eukprot:GHVN01007964.1.p1 GENE.GHVN01007964.1~~GHVN01007964.1.p1  ORF type:complete len:218 (+),score=42.63 GHVN01007964.1:74-727(+)
MATIRRGALIVFEGIDRSGKSTQAKLLQERLEKEGIQSHCVTFPDRSSDTGKILEQYISKKISLPSRAATMLFSVNRWEKRDAIETMLTNGVTVIADRYSFSGINYGHSALGLDFGWCTSLEDGLTSPDLVYHMDVSPAIVSRRGGFGNELYEKEDVQSKVHHGFKVFSQERYWVNVDATQSTEEISQAVWNRYSSLIEGKELEEIKRFNKVKPAAE